MKSPEAVRGTPNEVPLANLLRRRLNTMDHQTEFDFTLPRGYVDSKGQVWKRGCMRLATAMDEINTMDDPRVQANPAYLPVLLLARVLCRLGNLNEVTPRMIENMFASDLSYLEDLYIRLNSVETVMVGAVCPQCSSRFRLQIAPLENIAQ